MWKLSRVIVKHLKEIEIAVDITINELLSFLSFSAMFALIEETLHRKIYNFSSMRALAPPPPLQIDATPLWPGFNALAR